MIEGHGDDRHNYGEIRADFSSNVPGGIDQSALYQHLTAHLALISRYPEPQPYTLEGELAEHLGVRSDEVIVTNGATEAIYLMASTLAGKLVAVVEPTFAEYADACHIYGVDTQPISTPFDLPANCRALWCCNPNNPTGRAWNREKLLQTIDNQQHTLFIVDQSYEAFTRIPTLSAAESVVRPNLVLIGSMTKRYAVPGLRLGYLVASSKMCETLRCRRMPWSVNALAIEAGRFLLRNGVGGFCLETFLNEASRLAGAIEKIGLFAPQLADTHFFVTEMKRGTAARLKDWLARENGILIRNADNFRGLTPRHFRLAAQSPADNDLLIAALEKWITI